MDRFTRIENNIKNLYRNVIRFHWTFDLLIAERNKIYASENFKKLTKRDQSYLNGYIRASWDNVDTHLTHSYLCKDGLFRPYFLDGWTKYDMPSANTNRSLVEGSCIRVWADNPEFAFSIGGFDSKDNPDYLNILKHVTVGSHTIMLPVEKPIKLLPLVINEYIPSGSKLEMNEPEQQLLPFMKEESNDTSES